MNRSIWVKCSLLLIGIVVFVCPAPAEDRWYLSTDVGFAMSPDLDVLTGGLDDWVSVENAAHSSIRCDATINPDRFQTEPGACGSDPAVWGPMNETFDGGMGILSGLALGYRMGSFRIEGEYFYRSAAHDDTAVPTTPDYDPSTDKGFHTVRDAVDDVLSNNFFANLYYDFRSESKLTPYLGIGAGLGDMTIEYRTLWHRTNDPRYITVFDTEGLTGDELAKAQALNRKVVGTITSDRAKLSDRIFGYQAIVGLNYQVSDPVSVGLKFRWTDYLEFNDESEYDYLRNHASVAGNPPVPVTYYVETDDIQFWGVSLNLKYNF